MIKDSSSFSSNGSAPPGYSNNDAHLELPPDLNARLEKLSLDQPSAVPTPDQCIAHLQLLEAFQQLREKVANQEGLFGIPGPSKSLSEKTSAKEDDPQLRIREKRWAVYVARAVDRFEQWWEKYIPRSKGGKACGNLTIAEMIQGKGLQTAALEGVPLRFGRDNLPPLDVLMVWHSYMLNPRCFFEDCFRYGKLDFYATSLPWDAISSSIDNVTFEYEPLHEAKIKFETGLGLRWDNLEDPMHKILSCHGCGRQITVPWTQGSGYVAGGSDFAPGYGYADSLFAIECNRCGIRLRHGSLRVQKFRRDLQSLLRDDVPLPGTVTCINGHPRRIPRDTLVPNCLFPSLYIKEELRTVLFEATEPRLDSVTMDDIRSTLENSLVTGKLVQSVGRTGGRARGGASRLERVAVRRMMSRYWYNSSPFALDLVGAVVRQGSFIERMHNIDWLHSPALLSTMERLIVKYTRFMTLMVEHPTQVAVPTLDVDLAWHTHQLSAQSYYKYTDKRTMKLVDHDDKIEETKLSDAFAWTSKAYQERYGEAYSACTCWYCEAIRESHTSSLDRLFKPKKKAAIDNLHAATDLTTTDPLRSPHISAHNAVRDHDSEARARVKAAELDKAYHKACARARKQGRKEPVRDEYFYTSAWGYPLMYPMYMPYAVYPGITGGAVYTADPCTVNTANGSYGACAAGTCGGMAAAGGAACAGTGGSCGGGACGGGGGGCGGGGGGGGGGGCGGGGGGGGGC